MTNKTEKFIGSNEYVRIHSWLRRKFGSADRCENEKCKGISSVFDWAVLRDKDYEKKRENFWRLCRSCHLKYDWNEDKNKRFCDISHTEEANKNRAIARTGLKQYEATKKKISKGVRKPILQLSGDGEVVREWDSQVQVTREFGVHRGSIYTALLRGYRCCGFYWKYKYE